MRRYQRGFDLISVLVAVSIIGILAGIALPNYFDLIMRRSVDAALDYIDPLQRLVLENHADGLPLDAGFTALAAPMRRLEQISINADTGAITLEWRHGSVLVEPINLGEPLTVWQCTAGTLEQRFRPSACRGGS